MADDDASSAEMRRPPDPDQLAVDDDTLERLLTGGLPPAQAPSGYAEVARLLAAAVAAPHPSELAGQAAALEELRAVTRARPAAMASGPRGRTTDGGVAGPGWRWSWWRARWPRAGWPARPPATSRGRCARRPGPSWPPGARSRRPRPGRARSRRRSPGPARRRPGGLAAWRRHRRQAGSGGRRAGGQPGPGGALPGLPLRQRRRAGREAGRGVVPGAGARRGWRGQGRGLLRGHPARRRQAQGTQRVQGTRAARPARRREQPGAAGRPGHLLAAAGPLTAGPYPSTTHS